MPWNGLGQYVLPPAFTPEVNGNVVDATRYNGALTDIASGISEALAKNGENVATANLKMGGFRLTGMGAGAGAADAVTLAQLTAATTLSGAIIFANGTNTVQPAIDSLFASGGGTVVIAADTTVTTTVVLKHGVNIIWLGDAKLVWGGAASGTVIESDPTAVPRSCRIYGLYVDVGASFTGTALHLHSSVGFYFDALRFVMTGATSTVIKMTADSSGGEGSGYNRNCGAHYIGQVDVEGVYGTLLETSGIAVGYDGNPQVVTLNTFGKLFGLDGRVFGINLKSYTDTNTFFGQIRVGCEANNAIGLQHGDGSAGVYNNTFLNLAVDNFASATGRIAVKNGANSKLLKIVALYNRPQAEGGVFVADASAISHDVTFMADTASAGSDGEIIRYQRKCRIAGEGFNGSAPVELADEAIAEYNMAEGGIQENIYCTLAITASDPESACVVWINPRRSTSGAQIKLISPPAASCQVAVGVGALSAGPSGGVAGKFNVHVTETGTVIFKNLRGAPVSVVYSPLAWFQGN